MSNARFVTPQLCVCLLGTVPYREAMAMQREISAARQAGLLPDVMLLLEHPPTYTRGRRSEQGELPLGEQAYRARGIEVIPTDRGGRVTYHAPGQLVGYPIMGVQDVIAHVRTMEAAIVAALADEGLLARSRAAEGRDFTGVWVERRKIASIGVHLSRAVATHGFAINVNNDLEPFSWIVPCGLAGVRMTSVARELSGGAPLAAAADRHLFTRVRDRLTERFCELLGRTPRLLGPLELQAAAGVDRPVDARRRPVDARRGRLSARHRRVSAERGRTSTRRVDRTLRGPVATP
jgi:lipoyl(octanoyl) transferase